MAENNTITDAPPDMRGEKIRNEAETPASALHPENEPGRSADLLPAVQNERDLQRVTCDEKPGAACKGSLSEEARHQISRKLNRGKAV